MALQIQHMEFLSLHLPGIILLEITNLDLIVLRNLYTLQCETQWSVTLADNVFGNIYKFLKVMFTDVFLESFARLDEIEQIVLVFLVYRVLFSSGGGFRFDIFGNILVFKFFVPVFGWFLQIIRLHTMNNDILSI